MRDGFEFSLLICVVVVNAASEWFDVVDEWFAGRDGFDWARYGARYDWQDVFDVRSMEPRVPPYPEWGFGIDQESACEFLESLDAALGSSVHLWMARHTWFVVDAFGSEICLECCRGAEFTGVVTGDLDVGVECAFLKLDGTYSENEGVVFVLEEKGLRERGSLVC